MTHSAQLTPVPSHSRRVTYILADFIFFFSIHTVFLFVVVSVMEKSPWKHFGSHALCQYPVGCCFFSY